MATSVSGIGTISSTGIGSNLDVTTIIQRLMAVESTPLTQLQTQASTLQSKLSSVGKMQSNFSTLRDKANALTDTRLWTATTASSSDTSAVKVSTGSDAAAGSYSVSVSRLASAQVAASSAFGASSSTVGAGSLQISLGSWDSADPPAFSAKSGAATIDVAIEAGDSLATVRDKINAAGAGVTASLVSDASGTRLALRSQATGAENGFRVVASETADDGNPATGLSALAYDPEAGANGLQRTTTAANAELTVNGIAISSASNTLDQVVDGLTLTLQKTTSSPVDVTVAQNGDAVKTAITDFVNAFNALAGFIRTETAYNADSKTAGSLQGDQSTLSLQSQLRAVLNAPSSASGTWQRLSEIGIVMKSDGTLETKAAVLDNALGNLGELRKLLAADGSGSAEQGFVRRFKNLADAALGSTGVLATRSTGLQASKQRNADAQEAMQARLDRTQARLQKQYSALDTQMATLTTLSNYMNQQITQMNKSSA